MTKSQAEFLCALFDKYDTDYKHGYAFETVEVDDGIEGQMTDEYYLVFMSKERKFIAKNAEFIVRDSKDRLSAKFLKEWFTYKEHNL